MLEIEPDTDGMSHDFANDSMLKVPEITHMSVLDGRTAGELSGDSFNSILLARSQLILSQPKGNRANE